MGYMRHHAIVVTTWSEPHLIEAHAKASELLPDLVSPIIDGIMNGYRSFFVAPDGSKEFWKDSNDCDAGRAAFVAWLKERDGPDLGYLKWCEVFFGDDDCQCGVVNEGNMPLSSTDAA